MSFSSHSKRGFTLIELMVVITIIGILSVTSYIPYDHYSRLSRLRVSEEKLRQVFEDAKLLSQNGQLFSETIASNADIGVRIVKSSPSLPSNTVEVWLFRHGTQPQFSGPDAKILRTVRLEDWVNINTLQWSSTDYTGILTTFEAPKGTVREYSLTIPLTLIGSGAMDIGLGYKTALAGSLYKKVTIRP